MTMLLRPVILLLTFCHLAASAQVQRFSFRNIGISEGLSQSSVVDITIDKTGFVWMATQDGLNRFDGHSFVQFPLNFDDITTPENNQLGQIKDAGHNKLLLVTRGGHLQRMNLLTQTIVPIKKIKNEVLPPVSCVFQDSAYLLIGTIQNGLWIHDLQKDKLHKLTDQTTPGPRSNVIKKIFKDSRKNYWILTGNGAIVISSALTAQQQFLYNAHTPLTLSSITEDQHGTIWLGSFGHGLFYKPPTSQSFELFTGFRTQPLRHDLVIETLLADKKGMIWIGTFSDGLYLLNPAKQIIRHLLPQKKDPYSLAYMDVLSITADQYGGIWIGTDGGGVSYHDERLDNFETLSRNNLPDDLSIEQVRAITTDRENNIWTGTSVNGLTVLGKQSGTVGNYKKIGSLLTDKDGDIWIGSQENGLDIVNAKTKKLISKFLPGQTIWFMKEDPSGNVWVATRHHGIYLLNKKETILLHLDTTTSPALSENNVRSLAFTREGNLFIGFEKAGVQLLDIRRQRMIPLPSSFSNTFNGSVLIRSMYYTPSTLWVGTFGNGLLAFSLPRGNITAITEKQGLRNNTIYGIQPDTEGHLWLSTNKGLCRLGISADAVGFNRSDIYFFSMEDGLQSNEFNTGAHYRSPDGTLYFGGISGLTRFHPSSLSTTERAVRVTITDIQADGELLQTDTLISYKKKLELPYKKNSVSFTFAALDVLSAGRMNYYYQLTGFDKDWQEAGTRNYAAYTHLPAGHYVFNVKANRNASVETSVVTSLEIIIQPPFWQTMWFIALCVLAIAATLYGIYRYRISQLIRLQKVRNRIASDLHDDIGSALTHINILSELSKADIDPKTDAAVFLGRISEEVTNSGQALDDIVWSINSGNDTMEQMIARMRRYAGEVFETKIEHFVIDFDDRFAKRKLNMEQRRDVFLLFKELINNIHKHARASTVEIRIWIDRNNLNMYVSDNGRGFDETINTGRNGLKNMEARTQKWKGRFSIDTAPGQGTVTRIAMPLV